MGSLTKWIVGAVTSMADPDRDARIRGLAGNMQQHLSRALQSNGKFTIQDLGDLSQYSARDLTEAKRRVYREALSRIWKDGTVTAKESATLKWAGKVLEMDPRDVAAADMEFAKQHFAAILARAMEDGHVSQAEAAELQAVASVVGTTVASFARQFFASEGEGFLRSIFLACIADGRLTESEWHSLLDTAATLGLSRDELLDAIRVQARHFVEHVLAEAKSDGRITKQEEATLGWLMGNLNLPRDYSAYVRDEVRMLKLLGDIADGRLPSEPYPEGLGIRSGEIVHLHVPAVWQQVKLSRGQANVLEHRGQLTLTDNRLIFSSPTSSHSVSYRRIVAYSGSPRSFNVQVEGKPQSCYTLASHSPTNYAIFSAAISKANQTLTEKTGEAPSRHIPREIRQRVWQKYGGKCVECSAEDYLEFDHIIPVAKGGSNSEGNIQLLCRKCNLAKSDAI